MYTKKRLGKFQFVFVFLLSPIKSKHFHVCALCSDWVGKRDASYLYFLWALSNLRCTESHLAKWNIIKLTNFTIVTNVYIALMCWKSNKVNLPNVFASNAVFHSTQIFNKWYVHSYRVWTSKQQVCLFLFVCCVCVVGYSIRYFT